MITSKHCYVVDAAHDGFSVEDYLKDFYISHTIIYQLRRDEETPGMLALAIALAALVWLLGVLLFTIARSTLYYGMSFAMVAEHLLPDA